MPLDTDTLPRATPSEGDEAATTTSTIATRMVFPAPIQQTWRSLMFYEEVQGRPPLHLRLLLPIPIRTEGDKSRVGAEAMCLYEGGHLLKRATHIEEPTLYEFEITRQALAVGGSMQLSGGRYELRTVAGGTEVTVVTKYSSEKWPRWLWRPLERFVCHMFHRFLLRSMRRRAESG